MIRTLTLSILLGVSASTASPALANTREMIAEVCGSNCSDTVGTQSSLRSFWSALQSMGTTDFIGSSFGGVSIDASSLLSASSVAGASELDRWLRTGQSATSGIASQIASKLVSGAGIDVGGIVGRLGSSAGVAGPVTERLASALSGVSSIPQTQIAGIGGGGTASCSGEVDRNLVSASETYVRGVMDASTKSEYGFSQLPREGGMFGGSCIDRLMQGSRDILFKPPQMADLLGQMAGMFGGGGSGGGSSICDGLDPMSQIAESFPSGLFSTGAGGFFPSNAGMSQEGGSGLRLDQNNGIAMVSSSSVSTGTVGSLF